VSHADTTSQLITLRTGKQVPQGAFMSTMLSLVRLQDERRFVELKELRAACRDRNYALIPAAGQYLRDNSLVQELHADGTAEIHEATRDIVLAAVEAEDSHVRVAHPERLVLAVPPLWAAAADRPVSGAVASELAHDLPETSSVRSGSEHRADQPAPAGRRGGRRTRPAQGRAAQIGD
jgi:hypothetical protein